MDIHHHQVSAASHPRCSTSRSVVPFFTGDARNAPPDAQLLRMMAGTAELTSDDMEAASTGFEKADWHAVSHS